MNIYCVSYEIDGEEFEDDVIASSKMEVYDMLPIGASNISVDRVD